MFGGVARSFTQGHVKSGILAVMKIMFKRHFTRLFLLDIPALLYLVGGQLLAVKVLVFLWELGLVAPVSC